MSRISGHHTTISWPDTQGGDYSRIGFECGYSCTEYYLRSVAEALKQDREEILVFVIKDHEDRKKAHDCKGTLLFATSIPRVVDEILRWFRVQSMTSATR